MAFDRAVDSLQTHRWSSNNAFVIMTMFTVFGISSCICINHPSGLFTHLQCHLPFHQCDCLSRVISAPVFLIIICVIVIVE